VRLVPSGELHRKTKGSALCLNPHDAMLPLMCPGKPPPFSRTTMQQQKSLVSFTLCRRCVKIGYELEVVVCYMSEILF
jgi:hypothetical protein